MTNRPLQGPSSASPSTAMGLNGVLLGNRPALAARVASGADLVVRCVQTDLVVGSGRSRWRILMVVRWFRLIFVVDWREKEEMKRIR